MQTATHELRHSGRMIDLQFTEHEIEVWRAYRDRLASKQRHEELSEATGLDDADLLEQLSHFGFNGENVAALDYAPVALMSWADGNVSESERKSGDRPESFSGLQEHPKAVELFHAWFKKRPSRQLLDLWEKYAMARVVQWEGKIDEEFGRQLRAAAVDVATASGGVLGFGSVCAGEQRILDKIAFVYGLSDEKADTDAVANTNATTDV